MEPMEIDLCMLSEKYAKFMSEIQPLVDLLKKTDKFDASEWLQHTSSLKNPNYEQETPIVPETQNSCYNSVIVEMGENNGNDKKDSSNETDSVWKEAQNIPDISAYYEDLRKAQLQKDVDPKTNEDDDDFEEI